MKNYNNIISKDPGIVKEGRLKKIFFNLCWGIMNITILTWVSTNIIGTGWEISWLILVMAYMATYWIIAEILYYKLNGSDLEL